MAYLLALETSGPVCSIGLLQNDAVLAVQEVYQDRLHARLVTAMAEQLLANLSLTPKDLAAVAVSHGPGSYTGLRIGASAAKGLCMALGIPLIAIPTLSALAQQVLPMAQQLHATIISLVDARRMEVYAQWFDAHGSPLHEPAPVILAEDTWLDAAAAQRLVIIGDGAAKLPASLRDHRNVLALPQVLPSVRGFAAMAWQKLQAGQAENIISYEPVYLKPPGTNPPRVVEPG